MLNTIVPVVMLSLLNVLVFLLPASSGEKMALAVTVLLSFTVYLSIISEVMPKTSESISILGAVKKKRSADINKHLVDPCVIMFTRFLFIATMLTSVSLFDIGVPFVTQELHIKRCLVILYLWCTS